MLAHDPLSSLAYPMITHTNLEAGNLPTKTLVAIQRGRESKLVRGSSEEKESRVQIGGQREKEKEGVILYQDRFRVLSA